MKSTLFENLMHVPLFLILCWALYRKFVSTKPISAHISVPLRLIRLMLIISVVGLLAACTDSDPLAVASGPLFPLNIGQWQPTPQELAAVPVIADR